jgi:hypothetical protein
LATSRVIEREDHKQHHEPQEEHRQVKPAHDDCPRACKALAQRNGETLVPESTSSSDGAIGAAVNAVEAVPKNEVASTGIWPEGFIRTMFFASSIVSNLLPSGPNFPADRLGHSHSQGA